MKSMSQIEEMVSIIDDNISFDDCGGGTCSCDSEKIAEALYNAGYRNLGGERKWQRKCAYKNIEPQIRGCLDREREYIEQLAEIRKKTAEEFAKKLKEAIQGTIPNSGYSGEEIEWGLEETIDEILQSEFVGTEG